jgi:hypothetical protein
MLRWALRAASRRPPARSHRFACLSSVAEWDAAGFRPVDSALDDEDLYRDFVERVMLRVHSASTVEELSRIVLESAGSLDLVSCAAVLDKFDQLSVSDSATDALDRVLSVVRARVIADVLVPLGKLEGRSSEPVGSTPRRPSWLTMAALARVLGTTVELGAADHPLVALVSERFASLSASIPPTAVLPAASKVSGLSSRSSQPWAVATERQWNEAAAVASRSMGDSSVLLLRAFRKACVGGGALEGALKDAVRRDSSRGSDRAWSVLQGAFQSLAQRTSYGLPQDLFQGENESEQLMAKCRESEGASSPAHAMCVFYEEMGRAFDGAVTPRTTSEWQLMGFACVDESAWLGSDQDGVFPALCRERLERTPSPLSAVSVLEGLGCVAGSRPLSQWALPERRRRPAGMRGPSLASPLDILPHVTWSAPSSWSLQNRCIGNSKTHALTDDCVSIIAQGSRWPVQHLSAQTVTHVAYALSGRIAGQALLPAQQSLYQRSVKALDLLLAAPASNNAHALQGWVGAKCALHVLQRSLGMPTEEPPDLPWRRADPLVPLQLDLMSFRGDPETAVHLAQSSLEVGVACARLWAPHLSQGAGSHEPLVRGVFARLLPVGRLVCRSLVVAFLVAPPSSLPQWELLSDHFAELDASQRQELLAVGHANALLEARVGAELLQTLRLEADHVTEVWSRVTR